jgi:hypothetical protein
MSFLVKKSVFLSILLILAIAFNYMLTLIGADENLKLLTLSLTPYLFYIVSRKKYILLLSTLMLFKFLLIGSGLLHFDYFYVDGEAFHSAYMIIKNVFIEGGEVPHNQQHILNSSIWLAVGFYYYLLGLIMSSSDFNVLLAFNYLFIYFSALVWIKINKYSQISIVTSVLLLISPESYIFGMYIGKEVILLFLAMIAIYIAQNIYLERCNQKKQYLLLIAVILVGTLIRPYFITIVIAYLIFLNPKRKRIVAYLFMSYIFAYALITMHYELYNLTIHLRNFAANYLGIFLSPNLSRLQNWDNFFFLTTFQMIGLSFIFLSIILTFKVKSHIKSGLVAVFFYAIPMALVVNTYSHHIDSSVYAFYIPRSRFPIIFIIYTVFSISISHVIQLQSIRRGNSMFLTVSNYCNKLTRG